MTIVLWLAMVAFVGVAAHLIAAAVFKAIMWLFTGNRRKSVKQKCRNLHSETAENCMVTQESADNLDEVKCTLRCDYCGRFAKESEITFEWNMRPDRYLMCRKCKEKENA
jgi:hypothetical protein